MTCLTLEGILLAKKLDRITHKLLLSYIYDNHIKFEVSLHFLADLAHCAAPLDYVLNSLTSMGILAKSVFQ